MCRKGQLESASHRSRNSIPLTRKAPSHQGFYQNIFHWLDKESSRHLFRFLLKFEWKKIQSKFKKFSYLIALTIECCGNIRCCCRDRNSSAFCLTLNSLGTLRYFCPTDESTSTCNLSRRIVNDSAQQTSHRSADLRESCDKISVSSDLWIWADSSQLSRIATGLEAKRERRGISCRQSSQQSLQSRKFAGSCQQTRIHFCSKVNCNRYLFSMWF